MKKIAFSVLATGSLALLIGASDTEASSYTTKSGDTLWKIASVNKVSVTDIKKWNNLSSDTIYPNQALKLAPSVKASPVPAAVKAPAVSKRATSKPITSKNTYIVKAGDTLSKIAQSHKTTVSAIQKANNISDHIIYPGQKLSIKELTKAFTPAVSAPAPSPSTPAPVPGLARTYQVVSGDTLSGIAYRHGVSITQVMNWNGLTSSLIRIGQKLKIENSTVAVQPVKAPAVPKPVTPVLPSADTEDKIISIANSLTGTPYVWGGSTSSGFDCSGFIYYVYSQSGVNVPRTSTTGFDARSYDVDVPKAGDLVFFKDTYRPGISHAGIYIGNNKFIHANTKSVQVADLTDSYWTNHFDSFKRLYALD